MSSPVITFDKLEVLRADGSLGHGCRNKILTLRQTPEDAEAQDFKACVEHFRRCGWSEADFAASAAGADVHMALLLARVAKAAGIAPRDEAAACAPF